MRGNWKYPVAAHLDVVLMVCALLGMAGAAAAGQDEKTAPKSATVNEAVSRVVLKKEVAQSCGAPPPVAGPT